MDRRSWSGELDVSDALRVSAVVFFAFPDADAAGGGGGSGGGGPRGGGNGIVETFLLKASTAIVVVGRLFSVPVPSLFFVRAGRRVDGGLKSGCEVISSSPSSSSSSSSSYPFPNQSRSSN
jgi:hypothetical protein